MSETANSRRTALVCLALVLVTAAVYWPAHGFQFIAYDDPGYVGENVHIRSGFSVAGIVWAFTKMVKDTFYWMPMTWLSHMLDCQLFGVNPGAHHLMSVAYHAANAVLVFLLLRQVTGAFWRSAVVAALFAWHPLQVDSVAWIAERKNLVSAFFLLLTLMAYVRYARNPAPARYILAFFLLCLAVMAKPAAVMAPGLMLVLDFWPLRRLRLTTPASSGTPAPQHSSTPPLFVFLEKLPMLIPVAVTSVATVLVHQSYKALPSLHELPISVRLANAFVSYLRYVGKAVWPVHLAIYYPSPKAWPVWLVALAVGFVVLVSLLGLKWAASRPWFIAGWLWFLGGLFPNIGLVQAGSQSMGDRFVYVPMIGLWIMVVWLAAEWLARVRARTTVLATVALIPLLAGLIVTSIQLRHWRNTVTVFEHAVAVTKNNALAHDLLAATLAYQGKTDEAIAHCKLLLAINPNSAPAHRTWGLALEKQGDRAQAVAHFLRAIELEPTSASIRYDLARALQQQGRTEDAIRQYRTVVRLDAANADACDDLAWMLATAENPTNRNVGQAVEVAQRAVSLAQVKGPERLITLAAACLSAGRTNDAVCAVLKAVAAEQDHGAQEPETSGNLGPALVRQGHTDAGLALLSETARSTTNSAVVAEIERQIGLMFSEQGKYEEAAVHYGVAVRANPRLATAQNDWGVDLAAQRRFAAAAEHFAAALKIDPQYAVAHWNMALALIATDKPAEARAHLNEAIRLKPRYVSALNDLAWLLATCPDGNLRNAREALRLAKRATDLTDRADAGILETLAAAYAEGGRFSEASRTVEEAIQLCGAANQKELLATLENCRQRFRAGQPLRQ
jgi:tetratricopeptide (TPR) repeat protein